MMKFLTGNPISIDLALLVLRVASGALIFTHGWPKLMNFTTRMNSFADPYDIGSLPSLILIVLAEVFCSILLIVGYFTRFATIPLIIAMATLVFVVHWPDPFSKKELPIFFLAAFLTIFLAGPGKYSIDNK